MKKQFASLLFVVLACAAAAATAQTYPWSNPQYTPLAVLGTQTLSAPGTVTFLNSGSGVVSITAQGTCTGLTATAKVSNDGTNYVTTNLYPLNATVASSAVTSIAATGVWRANVQAMRYIQFNISALTAYCTIGMVGDTRPLILY